MDAQRLEQVDLGGLCRSVGFGASQPAKPATEATPAMTPWCRRSIPGSTAAMELLIPLRLVWMCWSNTAVSQSAGSICFQ